jgi:hypothetical protein
MSQIALAMMLLASSGFFVKSHVDGTIVDLPALVVRHFRNPSAVRFIGSPVPVDVVDMQFGDRQAYLTHVVDANQRPVGWGGNCFSRSRHALGVPDTWTRACACVRSELNLAGAARLRRSRLLPASNESSRTAWIESKRRQLAACLDCEDAAVRVAKSPQLARDVVFFFVEKT